MSTKGGNTEIYQGDGRLHMARAIERLWPHVVGVHRRFSRPQHIVKDYWRKFDTPLKRKPGVAPATMKPNEYGMKLQQVAPEIKSGTIRRIMEGGTVGAGGGET